MIKSYRDKETRKLASGKASRRIPQDIHRRAKMRLERLDAAVSLDDLRVPPSHRLEALSGDRRGQHGLRVNDQWRICFECRDGHAYEVEIVDYH
jgi:proteic killer suppression protein